MLDLGRELPRLDMLLNGSPRQRRRSEFYSGNDTKMGHSAGAGMTSRLCSSDGVWLTVAGLKGR